MSKYESIQSIIDTFRPLFPAIELETDKCLGHVLTEDIIADAYAPPFNKSAVDGYACRREDLGNKLELLEIIPAGKIAEHNIGKNQCSKIMTGAAVPEGADCVFMVEDAENIDDRTVKCLNDKTKLNICYIGEDNQPGDVLLKKGTILGSTHLAVIAGVGKSVVKVTKMPSVGLIVTGSELVPGHITPQPGKIRDTNSIQLISLLKQMHLPWKFYGIIKDDYEILLSKFREALGENEIVIFTGGAAVGDFDLVPKIIEDEGFETLWTRTGLKPGNPMSCAVKEQKYVFGLSGNPVSSFVQFEYLTKPAIYRLIGANYTPFRIQARTKASFTRKNGSRFGIIPVKIINGEVEEMRFNGSGHMNAIPEADAMMEFPVGKTNIEKGAMIYVRPV